MPTVQAACELNVNQLKNMELLQDKSFLVALIALFGVLINALVTAYNSRRRAVIDRKLILLKSEIEQLNVAELAKQQADYSERLKRLEHDLEQNSKLNERQITTDKKTLKKLTDMFDEVEAIYFLREHDFGGSFDREKISPLNGMMFYSDEPANKMVIKELESLRKEMINKAQVLQNLIGGKTFPQSKGNFNSVLPEEYANKKRPDWVIQAANELNVAATDFVTTYDDFVYRARSVLG